VLVAWSADDAFFPVGDAQRLVDAMPRATLRIVPGARTFSMLDQPDVLAEAVARLAVATPSA
jgi:pimeloyl-ACP methyl ester carboxylesterase